MSKRGKKIIDIRDIIIDPGDEVNNVDEYDNFEDTRIELINTGHNLVSL